MARKNETIDRERYLLLKGMLEDRRREIHEKLRSLREAIPMDAHDVRDAEEQSVDDFVQEVDLALMQMKSETLKKIDQAHPAARERQLRALPGVRAGDRLGAPARAALRAAVPRLPGRDARAACTTSARPRPSRACRRSSRA